MQSNPLRFIVKFTLLLGVIGVISGCSAVFGTVTAVDNKRLRDYQVVDKSEIGRLENGALIQVKLKNGMQLDGHYLGFEHQIISNVDTNISNSNVLVIMKVLAENQEVAVDTSQIKSVQIKASKRSVAGSVVAGAVFDVAIIYVASIISINPNFGLNL